MSVAVKLLFLTFLASSSGYELDVESITTDYLSGSEDTSVTNLLLALLGKIRDLESEVLDLEAEVSTLKLNDADQNLKLATLPYIEDDIEDLKQNDGKQDLSLSGFDRTLTTLESQSNQQELKISELQTDFSSLLDSSVKQDSDIETLNSTVIYLQTADNEQSLKITDIDSSLTQLQLSNNDIEKAVLDIAEEESCAGVIYEDTCIRLLYIVGKEAGSWQNAGTMCQFHGGRLAEIETDQLFDQVFEYVKKSWNSHTNRDQNYVNVLLGMKYLNGELVFVSSGNSVPGDSIGFWKKGYPSSSGGDLYMRMSVPTNRPTSSQRVEDGEVGFFNLPSEADEAVPLCQFPLMI